MRFLFSFLPERFRVLLNAIHNQGSSINDRPPGSVPSSSSVRIPLNTSVIVPPTRVGPSGVPLTNEDLPLLSELRRRLQLDVPLSNESLRNAQSALTIADSVPENQENVMGIRYRHDPGRTSFLNFEFEMTNELIRKLTNICNSIGIKSSSVPYYIPDLFVYSRFGDGLRSLVHETYDKVLVEILSFYKGRFGRFIILVSLGVSCTVWYTFVPGNPDIALLSDLFPRFETYQSFLNPDTYNKFFHKICYIERSYITGEVLKTIENEFPFSELNIPEESGGTRVAVGLGLMIGVFLAMGIVPFTDRVPVNLIE
uniref:Uncharacterized protein n=1 Tax=Helianthus annuus TaxID=4232 RepID=A0A5P8T006_HELAN|nr:hypothetical protein [Helianthus annuus]